MITEDPQTLADKLAERYRLIREAQRPQELVVGSFGIKYASFHEYGTKWSSKMPYGFFKAVRDKKMRNPNKNVMEFRGGVKDGLRKLQAPKRSRGLGGGSIRIRAIRMARIKPRPFMRPAFEKHYDRIIEIITKSFSDDPQSLQKAYERIGGILTSEILQNVNDAKTYDNGARGPITDNGQLLQSIQYHIRASR